ncbi:MAG: hypothetical protein SFZ24_07375 [Planctomycetota bacterium]|nr:hypothetical protein [Planctomycetota bacterium]
MNARSRTTGLLAVITGLLGVFVVADMAGLLGGQGAGSEAALDQGARAEYLDALAASNEDQALLDSADRWRDAAARARDAWARTQPGLISGPTPELAEARFRELVLEAMKDVGLTSTPTFSAARENVPAATGAVRRILLRVDFDSVSTRDVFAILDRLENLRGGTEIRSLRIEGPGRVQLPKQVSVSVTIAAAAVVGEGGS